METTTKMTAREKREAESRAKGLASFKSYLDGKKSLRVLPPGAKAYEVTEGDETAQALMLMRDSALRSHEIYIARLDELSRIIARAKDETAPHFEISSLASTSVSAVEYEAATRAKMDAVATFASYSGWFVPEVLSRYERAVIVTARSVDVAPVDTGEFKLTMTTLQGETRQYYFNTEFDAYECAAKHLGITVRG